MENHLDFCEENQIWCPHPWKNILPPFLNIRRWGLNYNTGLCGDREQINTLRINEH